MGMYGVLIRLQMKDTTKRVSFLWSRYRILSSEVRRLLGHSGAKFCSRNPNEVSPALAG